MALAYTRTLTAAIATTTINAAATADSAEIDNGDNTLIDQAFLFMTVTGFAAAPTGNMQAGIVGLHTSGGTEFNDNIVFQGGTVSADAQYDFFWRVGSLPRFLKVRAYNNTNQNSDASAVSVWLERVKVTV